uniref:GSVIVT00033188001, NIN1 n=1 Tax=Arundo donax TaxID=35708 RepID=A0A0A9E1H0_ARUDO
MGILLRSRQVDQYFLFTCSLLNLSFVNWCLNYHMVS